jgi:general L-amino acid transport system permease protein
MTATRHEVTDHVRTPWWRNVGVLRIIAQVAAVVIAVLVAIVLLLTARTNLNNQGISTSFDFLTGPTNFSIGGRGAWNPDNPIWQVALVGAYNTLMCAVLGLPLTTVLGVIVGVGRLSRNYLVRKAATLYVETLRNIPPLLVILFTFSLILLLPTIQDAATPFGLIVISNQRIAMPSIANGDNAGLFWLVMLVALVITLVVWRWRTAVFNQTGRPHHRVAWSLGTFLGIAVVAYLLLGGPISLSRPDLEERVITGGFTILASYATVTLALTVYTASHVAEIVRGSILAVPKGQTEASFAVGLTNFQRYRFVILPQAARIAIPPTINQYLNFIKNTSLALAAGYAEVTFVMVTVIGNANPAPQSIAVLMVVYLFFSLTTSIVMNIVNRRLQLATQR